MKRYCQADKMRKVLHYLLEHISQDISVEETASRFGNNPIYFAKIFEEYFELPFQKYVNKIKLRKAAKALYEHRELKTIAEEYGYSTTGGFSKAFRKEFGVSPREFLKRGTLIPDMPLKSSICGRRISIEYVRCMPLTLAGYPIQREEDGLLNTFQNLAYAHEHPEKYPFWPESRTLAGVWWCNTDEKLYYLLGSVIQDEANVQKPFIPLTIPSDNYAVFHIETTKNPQDIVEASNALAQYISAEWAPLNGKVINYMSYLFEVFEESECCIYVPLLKGMGGMKMVHNTGNGIDTWIQYIDNHILEDITIRKIASHFHYSPNHFSDIFQMYYNVDLLEYIQKRKLYQIARELKSDAADARNIGEKYHFKSYEHFSEAFYKEFHMRPEQYRDIQFQIPNLPEYYSSNKNNLKVSYTYLEDFTMLGMEIKSQQTKKEDAADIPGLCAFYFRHDFPTIKGTAYACPSKGKEDKIGLWNTVYDEFSQSFHHLYMLGPVVKNVDAVPENMQEITIAGGKYAVFETEHSSDKLHLETIYKMMTICVLYGWVKEFRVRVDLDRITFMRYRHNKLYTYVPIYE